MTDSEKSALLSSRTNETDSDTLTTYLSWASHEILLLAYPFATEEEFAELELPSNYDYLQVEVAEYFYNKMGATGQTVHNENGVNRQWEKGDLPDSLLSKIMPHTGGF